MTTLAIAPQYTRLDVLQRVSSALNTQMFQISDEDKKMEESESYLIPTIGSEIEVSWRAVLNDYAYWFNEKYADFSDKKRKDFDVRCDRLDAEIKSRYEATVGAGIPKGKEGYHEFANAPVNWYKTLGTEIRMLFQADLIPLNYSLPFHITIGGVNWGKEVGIATSLIQLMGGSSPARLTMPTQSNLAWYRGHLCGIKERKKEELTGRYSTGIEIRTLIAETPDQVENTLRNTQLLNVAIRASQVHSNKLEEELARKWEIIQKRTLDQLLKPHGLNTWWRSPVTDKSQWASFGRLYESPTTPKVLDEVKRDLEEIEKILKTNANL